MMLRNIMDGKYEFVSPEWDIISDSAKDLVSCNTLSLLIYTLHGTDTLVVRMTHVQVPRSWWIMFCPDYNILE